MGGMTDPTLYHCEELGVIIYLYKDPELKDQSVLNIYSDKNSFTKLQKIVIPYSTYRATFSIDRRSTKMKLQDNSIHIGLAKSPGEGDRHKLAKL